MPDAGRTRGPCVLNEVHSRTQVSQGSRDTRHSPRDGLRLIRVLLGVPQLSSHRPLRTSSAQGLDPSIGGSGPHDFAVRDLKRVRQLRRHVHRSPPPTFLTTAKRPSQRRAGWVGDNHDFPKDAIDFPKCARNLFLREGLDRGDGVEMVGEIGFLAHDL